MVVAHLNQAKQRKHDEYYTRMVDIENELRYYQHHFEGKVVYCNCDKDSSNFVKYFRSISSSLGRDHILLRSSLNFLSAQSIRWLKQSDVVVTNPPFSLFREYVAQLIEHDKKFLILGNPNAISYKSIFPLLKENKMWVGVKRLGSDILFEIPEKYQQELVKAEKVHSYRVVDGEILGRAQAAWFTNLENYQSKPKLKLTKLYDPSIYPFFDNINAINVNKVKDIPADYSGAMGVPLAFMQDYDPEQFRLLDFPDGKVSPSQVDFYIGGKKIYNRVLIERAK